jgi:predicted nucleic acid-binding protein
LTFLLDTNVVSEIRRRNASAAVVAWYETTSDHELFVSAMVLGEVRTGIERLRRRDPAQAATLERWLHGLYDAFADRIIPIDGAIAEDWGSLNAADPMPLVDGLMAATARVRRMVLVTRNVAHVARPGVRVLNPWEPPPEEASG